LGTGRGIGGGELLPIIDESWGGNSISVEGVFERVVEASDEERRIGGKRNIWG